MLIHDSAVVGFRFFPFGDRVLTWGHQEKVVVVWDTRSGVPLMELQHSEVVKCAKVFPGGDRVVTRSEDGATIIWDAHSGARLHIVGSRRAFWGSHFLDMVRHVEVSPSGARLLTWGRSSSATVLDANTARTLCVLRGHTSAISVARIFPEDDGRSVTGGFDHRAIIWNMSSCDATHMLFHSVWLQGVAALGAGETVATITIYGVMTIWDTQSGARLRTLVEPPPLRLERSMGVEPFPRGDLLATFNSAEAIVWNTSSGKALHRFVSKPNATQSVAISPGGDIIATCGGGRVTVWDAVSGAELQSLEDDSGDGLSASANRALSCFVALAFGGASDGHGFGRGFSWRELPELSMRR